MGERLRAFDWSALSIGAPSTWPQPLKTLVELMLAADQPMFVAWGPERTLIYNDRYATLLADKHPAAVGRPFMEVWAEVEDELTPLFARVFAGEPIHMDDITLTLRRRGRPPEAHFAFSYTPVRDERGEVVGLFCPCTETTETVRAQKVQDAALAQTEEALRQAQKMEALGQLTGGIAHDFNNLLTGIIGSLNIVRRRLAAGRTDDVARFMEAASTSAQRAAALTHRLLAFARRQSLEARPADVNRLVEGLEELLRRTLGEQVRLETALAADLAPALTDANQLENALLNLCLNARDAMPEGGRLTIATADAQLDEAAARLADGVAPGDYVVVRVSDTGVGMPPEVLDKAFEPFFTTKPIGQGTGLGLSMIYGFAKQSGGLARIDSAVGRGTTVSLYLPRAPVELVG